ncbi:OmpA family protein [Roseovarius phycicola]|uniref:OmpA family protein n=1 Tax=Roseovarius phycicola TaxID=3080976 RepID=A0ABZ2HK46_9RHOB
MIAVFGGIANAIELELPPGASLNREINKSTTSYLVPTGPFDGTRIPSIEVEGALTKQAWQFSAPGLTSLQIMRPLRDQIAAAGYEVILDCAGQECGGFDFRYQINVLPAPDMFVDLFNYRFLVAASETDSSSASYLTLLVSRVGAVGYLQVTRVSQTGESAPSLSVSVGVDDVVVADSGQNESMIARLQSQGHVVLSDLEFESGSGSLGPGPYASLTALAEFLTKDETRRVALVGHTDTVGGLEANLTLSKRRAEAVRDRLVREYGVSPDQLEANGASYLAPVASNLTPEGRETNRRVEAVLLNTE